MRWVKRCRHDVILRDALEGLDAHRDTKPTH
jgi:hypothetical protein